MHTVVELKNIDNLVNMVIENVNSYLKNYFKHLHEEASAESVYVDDLVSIVENYTLRGGKRLRAVLALIGYLSRKREIRDLENITKVMSAIELLQSYLLVHDDIMDRDELRRGGPTVHAWFRRKCEEMYWKDCVHYGISQAITSGDYLEANAVSLLASLNVSARTLADLMTTYSKGLRKVAYGQYLDVLLSQTSIRDVKESDVLLVYKLKTSSYTVELPLHLGIISSENYDEKALREATNYAIPAGLAFQIRDDIIGLYGDPMVTGKPVGSDVRGKKKTLLVVKAYELADENDRSFLKQLYDELSEADITLDHIERVRNIVRKTGSLEYCERLLSSLVKKALESLDEAREISEDAKKLLKELTLKLAYREK